MKTLIVIDMQYDFISEALGTPEARAIVPNVKKKIEEYVERGDEIIFTKDTHYAYYLETNEGKHLPVKHCIYGSYGWRIPAELKTAAGNCDVVLKNSFGYLDWDEHGAFERIELVGLCTDVCVVSNALILKAMCPETDITVDASCCAGTTPEKHRAALEVMKSCQIDVIGE